MENSSIRAMTQHACEAGSTGLLPLVPPLRSGGRRGGRAQGRAAAAAA